MTHGGDKVEYKMCVSCSAIVFASAFFCPICGGIIFEAVDLGGHDE